MRRILSIVLVVILLFASAAYAESLKGAVCNEIASQFKGSFDDSSSFSAESSYDKQLDAIWLNLTAKEQNHAFYEEKRASADIQPLYDMLANLKVYQIAKTNFDKYSITDVDVYVTLYSSDGILEYLEVNGRNISSCLSFLPSDGTQAKTLDTVESILNAQIEKSNQYESTFGAYTTFGETSDSTVFFGRRSDLRLTYDAFMQLDLTDVIQTTIDASKEMYSQLCDIGKDNLNVFSVFYTYEYNCVCVALNGVDVTNLYKEAMESVIVH